MKVGYFSAYYRGAECIVDLWPKIKEQVPEAELNIYYGWQSWVANEGEDTFYHRMNKKFKDAEKLGVKEHGRVSHAELAEKMKEADVWLYLTEFEEIFCITAVKANAAHCKPVITDVAALKETGGPVATFIETDKIYSDDYNKNKAVKAVVEALRTPLTEKEIKAQDDFVKQFEWANIASEWERVINED